MLRLRTFLLLFSLAVLALASSKHGDTKDCPPHQVHYTCGTNCPENCENHDVYPVRCGKNCRNACFCVLPYIFEKGKEGRCVLPAHCPRRYLSYDH
ncbi:cysteine-rich venom protein 6-like [Mantella aurantiaca]